MLREQTDRMCEGRDKETKIKTLRSTTRESTYCTECRGLDSGGPCICQLCWEPPLATVSRVRRILCTQSDNLTATTKHRCEVHTAGDKANQTRSKLFFFFGGNSVKLDKPPLQIKAAAHVCLGSHRNCLDLAHAGVLPLPPGFV